MNPSKPKANRKKRGSRNAPPTNAFAVGNPGGPGRPKDDPEFIEACREKTPKALATLEKAMDAVDVNPGAAVKAAEVLLNRGWGTAPTIVKLDMKATLERKVTPLTQTPERLGRIAQVLINAGVLHAPEAKNWKCPVPNCGRPESEHTLIGENDIRCPMPKAEVK
jgi:hypothetical protein